MRDSDGWDSEEEQLSQGRARAVRGFGKLQFLLEELMAMTVRSGQGQTHGVGGSGLGEHKAGLESLL